MGNKLRLNNTTTLSWESVTAQAHMGNKLRLNNATTLSWESVTAQAHMGNKLRLNNATTLSWESVTAQAHMAVCKCCRTKAVCLMAALPPMQEYAADCNHPGGQETRHLRQTQTVLQTRIKFEFETNRGQPGHTP
jgi:hypothetical protein